MRPLLLTLLLLASCATAQPPKVPDLIPAPMELTMGQGQCSLLCPWQVEVDQAASKELFDLLQADLIQLQPSKQVECLVPLQISFELINPDTVLPTEWYTVNVRSSGISVTATHEAGLFRGSRTLIQLMEQYREAGSIPCLTITDSPRFAWRGMHLDVCRHFFPVEFVKKYIDLLARYKMNTFHWHLTEDQGWRIEIKKYPRLTEVGAWRSGSQVGPYSRREYDSIPYGGFYTQDQIREVVAYAAARHITVVPEIEMPGHAMAALAAYPNMGCTGGPYEVQKGWGVFDDVFCAGSDSVFGMLEDVLTEVMDLFPGEYIHIGGDECPKERWKTCSKCQGRMKAEGLKDEHELQSYFIQRIEKFVNSKGRKIIGWDEILEGGLAPNAAVMSWRGTEGGVAAAKLKHNVVMSPGSHCYFDHYQGDPANEPLAIGGYTTVQKVYSYEPVPEELTPEQASYILGAQGNVWTEYILTPEHVEYMAVPRMLALAEVLWTPKQERDEADFIRRLESEFSRLEAMKVNASKSLYQVTMTPRPGKRPGTIEVELKSAGPGILMRRCICYPKPQRPDPRSSGYVTNSSPAEICDRNAQAAKAPCTSIMERFTAPIVLDWSMDIMAGMFKDEAAADLTRPRPKHFEFNLATARKVTLSAQPDERYNDGGAFTLVDGITAGTNRVNTEWLGWRQGVVITVDLGRDTSLTSFSIGALNEPHSWIHLPEQVTVSVSSDGKTFNELGAATTAIAGGANRYRLGKATQGRYVRFTVKHSGKIPEGFPGAGNPAWMFLDEIEVR